MNKTIAIMQPYFFPYIGYWQLINAVDEFVIYDDVNFIKGGWINRNKLLIDGEGRYFNLIMDGASPNKLINEVSVSKNPVHARKLLRTITDNYSKSPYFKNVFQLIEEIITHDETSLSKYLEFSIRSICRRLGVHTDIIVSSDLDKDDTLKGQEKIIDICGLLKSDTYINPIGGIELYDKNVFSSHGIDLKFLRTKEFSYKQNGDEFVPFLSILDVLMFNGAEKTKEFLDLYTLE